jgi:hypothetical protein
MFCVANQKMYGRTWQICQVWVSGQMERSGLSIIVQTCQYVLFEPVFANSSQLFCSQLVLSDHVPDDACPTPLPESQGSIPHMRQHRR